MANKKDFIAAYELHRMDIVSHLVAYHGLDMTDAEDVLQDVVLRTLEKWEACLDTLKHWVPEDLPGFLLMATHSRCKDVFRKNRRRSQVEDLYFGYIQ